MAAVRDASNVDPGRYFLGNPFVCRSLADTFYMTTMENSLAAAEAALVDDLSMFEDWNDRYEYIIGLGRELPPYPDELRTEDREVHGCQSQVWLDVRYQDGGCFFQADSNALITKGLVAMLVNLYNGRAPGEIQAATLDFLRGTGLAAHLTPSRVNGLQAMFKRIKEQAKGAQDDLNHERSTES